MSSASRKMIEKTLKKKQETNVWMFAGSLMTGKQWEALKDSHQLRAECYSLQGGQLAKLSVI